MPIPTLELRAQIIQCTREINITAREAIVEIGRTSRYPRYRKVCLHCQTRVDIVTSHNTSHYVHILHQRTVVGITIIAVSANHHAHFITVLKVIGTHSARQAQHNCTRKQTAYKPFVPHFIFSRNPNGL